MPTEKRLLKLAVRKLTSEAWIVGVLPDFDFDLICLSPFSNVVFVRVVEKAKGADVTSELEDLIKEPVPRGVYKMLLVKRKGDSINDPGHFERYIIEDSVKSIKELTDFLKKARKTQKSSTNY